jgi:Tfp pilus assembly protein PilP
MALIPMRSQAATTAGTTGLFGPKTPAASKAAPAANTPGEDIPQLPIPVPMPNALRNTLQEQRSMFSKGLPVIGGSPVPIGGGTMPTPTTTSSPTVPVPESHLTFNGVLIENGVAVAFIENTDTFVVEHVKTGDFIGRGTVGPITMSGLDYISGDHVTHVALGQNLTGAKDGTDPGTWGSSSRPDSDILEQMMKRRRAEMDAIGQ